MLFLRGQPANQSKTRADAHGICALRAAGKAAGAFFTLPHALKPGTHRQKYRGGAFLSDCQENRFVI